MLIGVPKEIKVLENRVGLTPASVRELVHHGHRVLVEPHAGQGIGAGDDDYARAGAEIKRFADVARQFCVGFGGLLLSHAASDTSA